MNNFEYYFEKAAQDMGMALFYAALLTILVTLIVRAYKRDLELFGFLNDHAIKHTADIEEADRTKVKTNLPNTTSSHKWPWHFGHTHAEA